MVAHGATPNSIRHNQCQHLLMLLHSSPRAQDTGLLMGQFSFPQADPSTCRSSYGHGITFKPQGSLQILEILVSIKAENAVEENKTCPMPPAAWLSSTDGARVSGAGAPRAPPGPSGRRCGQQAEWEADRLRCTQFCEYNWTERSPSSH